MRNLTLISFLMISAYAVYDTVRTECPDYSEYTATLLTGGHGGGSRSFLTISKPIVKDCKCYYKIGKIHYLKSICVIDHIYDSEGNTVHSLWDTSSNKCQYSDYRGSQFTGNSVKLKDGSNLRSRQYIKSFPFKPKTFYVDVSYASNPKCYIIS